MAMNMIQNERKFGQKLMLPILLIGFMTSATVIAKPFWAERGHHMEERFESQIEHLDLTDDQEKKADLILADLKQYKRDKQAHKGMHQLMSLNPDDTDYLAKVDKHADQAAANVKAKIIQMAKAKQSLYAILDESQKAKMSKMAERRLKKFEKRMLEKDEN